MLSRFAPRALAAPVRLNAARFTPALRTVTTDAASSHAEKSDIPEVRMAIEEMGIVERTLI
jgi:pyruvate dehydrogenase E1 component alpha subunit